MILIKKMKRKTIDFEPINDEDVINKTYLDEKLLKPNGHLSLLEKEYNDFILQYNKQSVEEILIQRSVETTSQILYDKGFCDSFPNANNVLKDFLFVTRRRGDLEKRNDDFIQAFCS